jgi:hypothetical protein
MHFFASSQTVCASLMSGAAFSDVKRPNQALAMSGKQTREQSMHNNCFKK